MRIPGGFRATSPNPADYTVVGSNLAMPRTILDGEAERLYKTWFQQPIPPNSVKLGIPMSFLLRDSFKFPTDKVAD